MAEPAYIRFFYKENPLYGPLNDCGESNLFAVQALEHAVAADLKTQRGDRRARHSPIKAAIELGNIIPCLYKFLCLEHDFLDKVEILWTCRNHESNKREICFKHTLFPVKIHKIVLSYPNIKDHLTEKYNHLVEISLRYRYFSFLYVPGYLLVGKYEWPFFYAESANTFESAEDIEKYATAPAITDELAEWEAGREKEETGKKIKVPWFVDCHSHEFSPKASPLPTIWVQNPITQLLKPSWETIEKPIVKKLISFIQHDLSEYESKTTEELGGLLMGYSGEVLKDDFLTKYMGEPAERERVVIALGIDMEMAHYGGYEGKTIYQKNDKGEFGYFAYNGNKREWVSISRGEALKIVGFNKQIFSTQKGFTTAHGTNLIFFPFDPRHWVGNLSNKS